MIDGLPEPLDYQGVRRALAGWTPFQGLVYFHLLLRRLQIECQPRRIQALDAAARAPHAALSARQM